MVTMLEGNDVYYLVDTAMTDMEMAATHRDEAETALTQMEAAETPSYLLTYLMLLNNSILFFRY